MSQAELIDRAAAAIGEHRDDDDVLAPTRHADTLAEKAPALARVLRSARIQALARQFERLDQEALLAQRKFKQSMERANWAVLVTAALCACIMVAGILEALLGTGAARTLLVVFGVGTVISGALASMWLSMVRQGNLLEAWMSGRAHAETARLQYFSILVEADAEQPSEVPLDLLKLEYFRRYQLDVEIAYYSKQREQHRISADRTLRRGGVAVALTSVASGAAGVLAVIATQLAALAALGVIGTALAAFASTREAVNQDRRNAERYGRTLSALEILRGRLDDVRGGVLAGSRAVLEEYVDAVHEQLSLEHRDWLSGAEATRSAIGKVDQALAELQKKRAPISGS